MSPAIISNLDPVVDPVEAPAPVRTSSLFSLSGRTTVITGGGRGLGLNLAHSVVDAGSHVACIDILPEPAVDEWASLLAAAKVAGVTATYYSCDITSELDVETVFQAVTALSIEKGAELRGVIACAGIQQKTLAVDYSAADFERMLRVNTTGVFITAKYAARAMMDRGVSGSIVLIASMSGQIANRGLMCSAYNTSKAAVHQMGRSLAQEWGVSGIRVNTLSPGVRQARPSRSRSPC